MMAKVSPESENHSQNADLATRGGLGFILRREIINFHNAKHTMCIKHCSFQLHEQHLPQLFAAVGVVGKAIASLLIRPW